MILGLNETARASRLAGVLVLILAASPVQASIQVGGGATLPALGYVGDNTHRLIASPSPRSLLGAYKNVTGTPASYCQTGSGVGKNILMGISGYNVQNACPDTPGSGFAASQLGRSTLTQPNFVASDSPLTMQDYSSYVSNRGTGRPLQFPAVAGSIAIVYRNDNMTDNINLAVAQVCNIFNGTITKWSQLGMPIPATGVDDLVVVYRSDGSGTSFGLSNFLSANCPGTVSQHFKTDQSFVQAVSLYSLPNANWNGQNGPALMDKVVNTDGAIGYSETSSALYALSNYALINGHDPVTDLGDPTTHKVALNASDVIYNNAITGVDANTGQPTWAPISGAPTTSCIALVKPSAYATQPSNRYPIVAVSYLLGNSQGNGTDSTDVRNLLGAPYNPSIIAATRTMGAGTGLAFLDVSATSIRQSQINGCVVN